MSKDVKDFVYSPRWVLWHETLRPVPEPTPMDYMLHNSRDHNFPDIINNKEVKLHHALYELSDDDRALLRNAHHFRDEVLRLREENRMLRYKQHQAISWLIRMDEKMASALVKHLQGDEEE